MKPLLASLFFLAALTALAQSSVFFHRLNQTNAVLFEEQQSAMTNRDGSLMFTNLPAKYRVETVRNVGTNTVVIVR
jgi:hypothetical protein